MTPFLITTSARAALCEIIETSLRPVPKNCMEIRLGEMCIGHIQPEIFREIHRCLEDGENEFNFIQVRSSYIQLELSNPFNVSQELKILAECLRVKNLIHGWRNEEYAFIDEFSHEKFRLERSVFRTFGMHSRAIHVNGFTEHQTVWLAKRSPHKQTDPGKLDNLTAGGIAADETIQICALRELWEEAGIPHTHLKKLNPISFIRVRRLIPHEGLHHETLYTFDLPMSDELLPMNQDGEVSEFINMSFNEAVDLVLTDELTPDAAAVTADFLLRMSS
jgi:8-oxo-dGTP pyrophosphatase MutT (NUDIX family)